MQHATDDRHRRLLSLLNRKRFSRQVEVAAALRKEGFDVTQSSVSRDFQDLGIVKVAGRYVPPSPRPQLDTSAIRSFVARVETAGPNLLVIKTPMGASNVVAVELDRQELSGLVGTVAGDDTIFIATKNRAAQKRIVEFLGMTP